MRENSDIGLVKMKTKGSWKVYKMVGRTTGLTKPYVVSNIYIYICNKIGYKYTYIYIYYYRRENIGLVLHSYRKIELSCASS